MPWWEVLGVDKSASKEEVQKAYKKLAKKYHPDISEEKDATEKMAVINRAYDEYDKYMKNPSAYSSDNYSSYNNSYTNYSSTNYNSKQSTYYSDYNDYEPDFNFFHEKGREGFYGRGFYYEHNPKNYRKARKRRKKYKESYNPFDTIYTSSKRRKKNAKSTFGTSFDDPMRVMRWHFIILDLELKFAEVKSKVLKFLEKKKQERERKKRAKEDKRAYEKEFNERFKKEYGTDNDEPRYGTEYSFVKARYNVVNKVTRKFNFGKLDYKEINEFCNPYVKMIKFYKFELDELPAGDSRRQILIDEINEALIKLCINLKKEYTNLSNEECIIIMEQACNIDCLKSHFCDKEYHDKINQAFSKHA